MAISTAVVSWRRRQKRGAIMRPSTFNRIARSAAHQGARDPNAVAGKAYWQAAQKKFMKRIRHMRRHRD